MKAFQQLYFGLIFIYYSIIVVTNLGYFPEESSMSKMVAIPLLGVTLVYWLITMRFFLATTLKFRFFKTLFLFILIYVGYYVFSLMGGNYYSGINLSAHTRVFFTGLFWMFAFFNFFEIGYRTKISERSLKVFGIVLYLLSTAIIFSDIFKEGMDEEILNTASGYTALMVMPLLFYYNKHRIFQIFLLTFLVTLISGKRGALVIEAIIFLYYLISYKRFAQIKISSSLTTKIIILFAIAGLAVFFYNNAAGSLAERMAGLFVGKEVGNESSIGSGRNIFWSYTFFTWYEAPILNNLLGLGFYSTIYTLEKLYGMPIQAHNDFLEILHGFGLLGISVYLVFQYKFYQLAKTFGLSKIDTYILITCFLIFVMRSIFAGLIYRPDTLLFAIAMGLILGNIYKKRKDEC